MTPPPSLTDKQLKTLDVLTRTKMAWVMLLVYLALLIIFAAAFLYALFFVQNNVLGKAVIGGFNGFIGWELRKVTSYLFPARGRHSN